MAVIIDYAHSSTTSGIENRRFITFSSLVVALGGVLFGYDLVIISGAVPFFKQHYGLNDIYTGWAVGCINLGAALGALVAGSLSELIGRKRLLIFCAVLFALTGVATGWAFTFSFFVVFRILSGVAVGIAALTCPVYIAEISPPKVRGRLVTLYQLAITIGLLLAYVTNFALLDSGEDNWRWMFSSQGIPAILFFVGLFFVPESPRWLVGKRRTKEAGVILNKIGGSEYAESTIAEIGKSFIDKKQESWGSLFSSRYKHILFVGLVIAIFSQADGQNSLFSYSNEIFNQAGMARDSAFLQSALLGIINFGMTFFAIRTIDRIGRKKLLLWGSFLLFIDAVYLAFCFWLGLPGLCILGGMLLFIGVFAATLGPVTWVIISEIFPNAIRGKAMGLATLSLWISNFVTTAMFPIMKNRIGLGGTFLIHAGICLIYFAYVWKKVPETKSKSLEEIELMLRTK